MISIKIHKSYRTIVAVADSNLLGKKFEEGNLQIDIREKFFKGDEYLIEKAKEIMIQQKREDSTFNIVGENSIKTALKAGIIAEQGIIKINNIPIALVLL